MTEGEPVIGGLHGAERRHYFCPRCMSWMFTRAEGFDWFVNLRATMLDDPAWFVPLVETCTREKLPWAATPAAHSYATLPAPRGLSRLMRSPRSADARSRGAQRAVMPARRLRKRGA